jgi:hypothetical protein
MFLKLFTSDMAVDLLIESVSFAYTVKKDWKALHFTMRILKKGNGNTRSLAYTLLVRPILEYGAACWDPYRKGR